MSFDIYLEIESDPALITMDRRNTRLFKKVLFSDSILDFFPDAEIIIPDNMGIFNEAVFFSEGLSMATKFGSDLEDFGFIEHKFVWANSKIEDTISSNYINGEYHLYLDSHFKKQDSVKRRSFGNKNISDVVKKVLKDYEYTTSGSKTAKKLSGGKNVKLGATDNNGVWYQPGQTDEMLFETLRKYALDPNNESSPFYTFFNLHNEFYFMTYEEMISSQNPVATFSLTNSGESHLERYYIKDLTFDCGGSDVNEDNYLREVFTILPTGKYSKFDDKISDHIAHLDPSKADKLAIRELDIENPSSIFEYGLIEEDEVNNLKGFINYLHKDTATTYQMDIIVPFNPDIASGRVIELDIKSAFEDKLNATEYNGKWLLLETKHFMDEMQIPYTTATIGRHTATIDPDHKFVKDFLSKGKGGAGGFQGIGDLKELE